MKPARLPSTDELVEVASKAASIAKKSGVDAAVAGGLAMQLYGSPRLTGDVDFLSNSTLPMRRKGRLTFGGEIYSIDKINVDWIVRSDEYERLYADALWRSSNVYRGKFRVVSPEFLTAIKFSAGRPKDVGDLMYLLETPRVVNVETATEIVREYLGGRFAEDQFKAVVAEAEWRRERSR